MHPGQLAVSPNMVRVLPRAGEDVMCHGDLIPGNVLVSMELVWYYAESNPAMSELGRRTLDRLRAALRPGRPIAPQPLALTGAGAAAGVSSAPSVPGTG